MRYHDLELRVREENGSRVIEIDGYHRVQPESKPDEYRRVAIVDLPEEQARDLHDRLGAIIDDWEVETTNDRP